MVLKVMKPFVILVNQAYGLIQMKLIFGVTVPVELEKLMENQK